MGCKVKDILEYDQAFREATGGMFMVGYPY